jgi:glutamyl-tRNA reductase
MPIVVHGINHTTAPIAIREQVALGESDLPQALSQLLENDSIQEVLILSTCNRTEIYCKTDRPLSLGDWFGELEGYTQSWEGLEAVQHLMQVASGLESMVLGEPQILGQIKQAYALAQQSRSVGKYLSRLFETAFRAAKTVRTRTGIGDHPVSVAYAAIKMAQHVFKTLANQQVILVGSGEMIDLCARHLKELGVKKMIFANRTLEHAEGLAERFQGEALALGALPDHLHKADMLISATASELPIIGKGRIEAAMKMRKYKPMVLIDLAVPRDIEPEIKELDNVYLYDIDGLGAIVKANQQAREKAALQAQAYITEYSEDYLTWVQTQDAVHAIKAYRSHHEKLRDAALVKAQRMIEAGKPTPDVLAGLAHHLTNQLLHLPTLQLKQPGPSTPNALHLLKESEENS